MLLVTGGAGFIGSNVVASLNEAGRTDIAVNDILGTGQKWRNLAGRRLAEFVPAGELLRWLEGRKLEAVVHMGAISSTTENDVDLLMENNFRLSLRLFEWCAASRTSFIYASSAATYGDGAAGFSDDWSSAGLARLRPLNPYGWSKHLFDQAVIERIARKDKVPPQWAGLKFFNVFGPNEYHKDEMMSLVAKRFDEAKAGKVIHPVQIAPLRHRRRRAKARLHLCGRCGRRGALAAGDAERVGYLQRRHRKSEELPRSHDGRVHSARQTAEYRICRHAGVYSRHLPVFHAGRDAQSAPRRLHRRLRVPRGWSETLRAPVSRSRRTLSLNGQGAGQSMFDFEEALRLVSKQTVLCVGDVMLDDFVYGEVTRISPEAPTPVLAVKHNTIEIGGAGNVARNIAALGATCIFVGLVGDDEAGPRCARRSASSARSFPNW